MGEARGGALVDPALEDEAFARGGDLEDLVACVANGLAEGGFVGVVLGGCGEQLGYAQCDAFVGGKDGRGVGEVVGAFPVPDAGAFDGIHGGVDELGGIGECDGVVEDGAVGAAVYVGGRGENGVGEKLGGVGDGGGGSGCLHDGSPARGPFERCFSCWGRIVLGGGEKEGGAVGLSQHMGQRRDPALQRGRGMRQAPRGQATMTRSASQPQRKSGSSKSSTAAGS